MTSPVDTIREALTDRYVFDREGALAALAQVEHQLAAHDREVAGLWQLRDTEEARAGAAEQRADDLADALRAIVALGLVHPDAHIEIARAALDRQEQT